MIAREHSAPTGTIRRVPPTRGDVRTAGWRCELSSYFAAAIETCEYEAYHALTLIDSKGRLSQRRLTRRGRRTIRVKVSGRMNDPAVEGDGSQITTLAATVTLRRLR
jgi:hypothetical protein